MEITSLLSQKRLIFVGQSNLLRMMQVCASHKQPWIYKTRKRLWCNLYTILSKFFWSYFLSHQQIKSKETLLSFLFASRCTLRIFFIFFRLSVSLLLPPKTFWWLINSIIAFLNLLISNAKYYWSFSRKWSINSFSACCFYCDIISH